MEPKYVLIIEDDELLTLVQGSTGKRQVYFGIEVAMAPLPYCVFATKSSNDTSGLPYFIR